MHVAQRRRRVRGVRTQRDISSSVPSLGSEVYRVDTHMNALFCFEKLSDLHQADRLRCCRPCLKTSGIARDSRRPIGELGEPRSERSSCQSRTQ